MVYAAIKFNSISVHPLAIVGTMLIFLVILGYILWRKKVEVHRVLDDHAFIDTVTGFDNFDKFVENATTMLKYNDVKYAVGLVDVNNFKSINDFYGRNYGDVVLKNVAERVNDIVMTDGVFARYFADRFTFIIRYYNIDDLIYRIKTYLSEIDVEIEELGENISISCNCGIYKVENYKGNINAMVDKAAQAAKISKSKVEEMITVLDSSVDRALENNQKLTYMMNSALSNNEFVAYIQPKISFRDGRIVGGEALVRWMSPTEGMISPGDFIPLFEQNGFVNKVDFYMLERICTMIKRRKEWGKYTVPISVNQSRVHVYDPLYINKLINIFDKYEINRDNIIFELTESAFTDNTDDMITLINRMSALGYKISMDDFGCGYSSLNMLNLLPISELKLDKQFLDDESEKSRFIIKTVVNLAHGLGMSTVCEGVEEEEQVKFLRQIGCDIAQGFYYAKPMPISDFEKFMDANLGIK